MARKKKAVRHCSVCGRTGHDARRHKKNPAKKRARRYQYHRDSQVEVWAEQHPNAILGGIAVVRDSLGERRYEFKGHHGFEDAVKLVSKYRR